MTWGKKKWMAELRQAVVLFAPYHRLYLARRGPVVIIIISWPSLAEKGCR
jgi:hypothetical protein